MENLTLYHFPTLYDAAIWVTVYSEVEYGEKQYADFSTGTTAVWRYWYTTYTCSVLFHPFLSTLVVFFWPYRDYRRYFYTHKLTGKTQWDYPDADEIKTEDEKGRQMPLDKRGKSGGRGRQSQGKSSIT